MAPVAIVASERLLFASPRLAEITGYTVNELTSPEFRLSYVIPSAALPSTLTRVGEASRAPVRVMPLRGAPFACTLTMQLISDRPEPTMVVVLEPGEDTTDGPEAADRAARALVDGLRSALAREMVALRKLEERIWSTALSRAEVLGEKMADLARMHEDAAMIEAARSTLERRVGAL